MLRLQRTLSSNLVHSKALNQIHMHSHDIVTAVTAEAEMLGDWAMLLDQALDLHDLKHLQA